MAQYSAYGGGAPYGAYGIDYGAYDGMLNSFVLPFSFPIHPTKIAPLGFLAKWEILPI